MDKSFCKWANLLLNYFIIVEEKIAIQSLDNVQQDPTEKIMSSQLEINPLFIHDMISGYPQIVSAWKSSEE